MVAPIGFVIASQSDTLARGVCEVVQPMASDVVMRPCGCHDEGLARAIELLGEACAEVAGELGAPGPIVILADLGPAKLAAGQLINQWGDGQVVLGRGPLVEGAMAGAVAAAQREDLPAVLRSIAAAASFFSVDDAPRVSAQPEEDPYAPRVVTVTDSEGLAARPAATLARLASDFDATVTVDGVDATSVLALMALRVACGDDIRLEAEGPEARMALARLADAISAGLVQTDPQPAPTHE